MRYEIQLDNAEPGRRGQTVVWIENNTWTQGMLGPAVRVGSSGRGTISVQP